MNKTIERIRFLKYRDLFKRINNTFFLANKSTDIVDINHVTQEEMDYIMQYYTSVLLQTLKNVQDFVQSDLEFSIKEGLQQAINSFVYPLINVDVKDTGEIKITATQHGNNNVE